MTCEKSLKIAKVYMDMKSKLKKEVKIMTLKNIIVSIIFLFVIYFQAFCMSNDPIHFRLNWKPNDTFTYRLELTSNAKASGELAQFQLTCDVALKVIEQQDTTPADVNNSQFSHGDYQTFAVSGRLIKVELRHGDIRMKMKVAGQKIEISAGKREVFGYLNGTPLPSNQIDELRRELKPLQDIMQAPICLSITDTGRVVKVSGLEKLDPDLQKELAMGFIEAMLLPEKPLKVGEFYTDQRSLESLFPKQPGNSNHSLAGQTIEIIRTLQSIRELKGKKIAEFRAPLKKNFMNVPIDENGNRGSMEFDIMYTTLIDLDSGTIIQEGIKGNILLHPNELNIPIAVEINATFQLIEPSRLKASNYSL
jgi:hypothetical protein